VKTPGRQHNKYNTHQRLSQSQVNHAQLQKTRGTPGHLKPNLMAMTGNSNNLDALASY